ncbi:MAG: hypothetical protein NTZ48_06035 [Candidatus Omnitrophica bacterium]|nr:hypothetical protein [Candidatus Omnitrophota bacterium]
MEKLIKEINILVNQGYKIVIVPGGGELVDKIREFSRIYRISDSLAHWMAIMAMDINGMFISVINNKSKPVKSVRGCVQALNSRQVPVFLPYRLLKKRDELPKSWEVTSDSISLNIAHILKAKYHILLKDIDGLYNNFIKRGKIIEKITAQKLERRKKRNCVDNYLAKLLLKYNRETFLLSGLYPKRIKNVLEGNRTRGTIISPH